VVVKVINGKKVKGSFCENCAKFTPRKELCVDHIEPVGSFPEPIPGKLGAYVDRLFCDVDNLQLLCKECHAAKTKREAEARKKLRWDWKNPQNATDRSIELDNGKLDKE
jgi:5-methylcytosine-specific restriction endonuclease McrA